MTGDADNKPEEMSIISSRTETETATETRDSG